MSTILVITAVIGAAGPSAAGTAFEDELLAKINRGRVNRGKVALVESATILTEARAHSLWMSTHLLSHNGFTGRVTRIRAADGGIGYVCENVAYASGYSDADAMKVLYRSWLNSPPHKKCMFKGVVDEAAVGLQKVGNTWWATFIAADDASP